MLLTFVSISHLKGNYLYKEGFRGRIGDRRIIVATEIHENIENTYKIMTSLETKPYWNYEEITQLHPLMIAALFFDGI